MRTTHDEWGKGGGYIVFKQKQNKKKENIGRQTATQPTKTKS